MTESESYTEVTNGLRAAFVEVDRLGFEYPWLVVVVAINGEILGLRGVQDKEGVRFEKLVDATGDFLLPINIMVLDATGEKAARFSITTGGFQVH